jgi:ketosteroid isomerase-like protein
LGFATHAGNVQTISKIEGTPVDIAQHLNRLFVIAFVTLTTFQPIAAEEIAKPQTPAQEKNLALVQQWRDLYNDAADGGEFVKTCYAPTATVLFTGASVQGHEQFMRLERAIKTAAPGRSMRIDRIRFMGDDVVVVEAVVLDSAQPDFFSPWIALLTIRDGKIVEDRTYLDPARWPGIAAATGIPTLGGLGAASTH